MAIAAFLLPLALKMNTVTRARAAILWPLEEKQEKHRGPGPDLVLNQGQQLILSKPISLKDCY